MSKALSVALRKSGVTAVARIEADAPLILDPLEQGGVRPRVFLRGLRDGLRGDLGPLRP
jgi:hypothetical protein